jgi:hypothetical protein
MRTDFWRLRVNRCIQIDQLPPRGLHAPIGFAQQHTTIGAFKLRIRVRKQTSNIAQTSRTE